MGRVTRQLLVLILAMAMIVTIAPAASATMTRTGGRYVGGTCYGTYYGSTTWIGNYYYSTTTINYSSSNGVETWQEKQTKARPRTSKGCLNGKRYEYWWRESYYRTRWVGRSLFVTIYYPWTAWR